jgi:hypothetical protein
MHGATDHAGSTIGQVRRREEFPTSDLGAVAIRRRSEARWRRCGRRVNRRRWNRLQALSLSALFLQLLQHPDGQRQAALDGTIHPQQARKGLGFPSIFGQRRRHTADTFGALAVHGVKSAFGSVDPPLPPQ